MGDSSSVKFVQQDEMLLFAISFNHHLMDLAARERLKLGADSKQALHQQLSGFTGLTSHLILDTCNRWEIYGVVSNEQQLEGVWHLIEATFATAELSLKTVAQEFRENRMIQHLFEVCAGVDSQMVGETEILGQVKNAFARAKQLGQLDSTLHRIFNKAFQAAKWVRTHTRIGQGQVSVGNISVKLASRIFGGLSSCDVLLVGSGEVGRLAAQALKNRDVRSIAFTSRTLTNAEALASEIGGEFFPMEVLTDRLAEFDIIVTCTSSKEPILNRGDCKLVMKKRSYRPLFMIDLAMPRDIEVSAGKISQLFLYNLDDVSKIANENLEQRESEITACRQTLSGKSWVVWLDVKRRMRGRLFRERMLHAPLDD